MLMANKIGNTVAAAGLATADVTVELDVGVELDMAERFLPFKNDTKEGPA
ncbi:hypothetical protein GCM10010911_59370 [Paenibacillus nasutitermitis]|uniref:Uncharacterized protein n=1 Tax=Paenibacillus nasutitermitis TaxID=1652958 RepID=A0A916ZEJ3_9BACL|nr:hypothetical protein GCM10010911_59370 [Paenibacillus nasutitermitis]